MDVSRNRPARFSAPSMSLSVGGDEFPGGGLHRGAASAEKGLQGMVQSSWFQGSGNSSSLKRRSPGCDTFSVMEASGLSVNYDATTGSILGSASPKPSESGSSTGSQTSSRKIFLRGVEDECFPTDLGLGLIGPSSNGLADGFSTSLASGGESALSFVDSGVRPPDLSRRRGSLQKFLLGYRCLEHGLAGNKHGCMAKKDMNVGTVDPMKNDLGMQLQLGLSRSSGQGGTYNDAGNENVSCVNVPVVDEGSTSARSIKAGGHMPSLLVASRPRYLPSSTERKREVRQQSQGITELGGGFLNKESASKGDLFMTFRASSSTTFTSLPTTGLEKSIKTCKFKGCGKGARGASGLCIIHGGGRRCQRHGCKKGAEGSSVYCKLHGGGRRCQTLGCTKSAEGKTDYCIAHGGGRRCTHDGCTKAARGRSGLCIRHGGGKRCQKEGCTKSAEGYSGLCISHGGGRRCQAEGCRKGAQGSTMFCKAHGGGRRCMIQGCNKGAEGSTPLCKGHGGGKRCMFDGGGICTKSVHGGTSFCVAHGGGKRCAVQECTRSARGRTSFCVRHGGGKRCKVENCTKSAQGSTDFCKAHGGGKRCSWGQESSPYSEFVKDKTGNFCKGPCERFARGKLGLCAAHCALVQDRRVHGAATIGDALLSSIGPGLFRGIVEGSTHAASHLEYDDVASKLSTQASSELGGDDGIGVGRVAPFIQADRLSRKSVSMESELGHAQELPPLPQVQTPTLAHCRASANFLRKERLPSSKVNEGSLVLSKHNTSSLWPGLSKMSGQCNSNNEMKLGSTDSFAPSHLLANESTADTALVTQVTGSELTFSRLRLPPQVLVPLSMRKGDSTRAKSAAQGEFDGQS